MNRPLTNTPPAPTTTPELRQVIDFFESLTPASVGKIATLYCTDARFVDPFNDVQGLKAIEHIFADMFSTLESPYFVVTTHLQQDQQCFLTWEFHFRFKRFRTGVAQTIRGGSHLVFDDLGKVMLHRDYWDAAQELYEKLPIIGRLMRWLRLRAAG